jgi:GTP-binding protein EngB required for normal cell division
MPGELLSNALFKKRESATESASEVFESQPAEGSADAKAHLGGLDFSAPDAETWQRSQDEDMPEEDQLEEALQEKLADRGDRPAHAPKPVSDEERARLQELAEALAKQQQEFAHEREAMGEARDELARREADLKAREAALEAEREEQRQREEARRNYPQPEWLDSVDGMMNIAITGNAGVGKSLLINKIRRARQGTEGWAPVGVNETTSRPTMYKFPSEPRVRLWDLPGAGTAAFPIDTYIQDMGLRYFDTVLIVTAGRFTSTEMRLREELEKHEVSYFMIRTKVDIDCWNNKEDNNLEKEETLKQIKDDLSGTHGIVTPYLVSSRDPEAYDMPKLMQDLFPGFRRELDPSAPSYIPGWSDQAWAMPIAYSDVLSGIQGRWHDAYCTRYIVQGYHAHVTLREGQSAVLTMRDSPTDGCLWWCDRWWINKGNVARARRSLELRWTPANIADKPLIWWWSDS